MPLVLPTIGAATCAEVTKRWPHQSGIARNLLDLLAQRNDAPEAELAALIEPPTCSPGIVESIKRAVRAA